ncbi:protein tyrosine phosphatase [Citrobacter sp. JGM124]|uniref:arsenate reductase/protein-tyrosine-phosphatase family protein n=1 Tax=Citrobacter sp. JGM124 TaxID=2799789 RepID=UPI001BAB4E8F|nr:protein tyrosine phosphatase [Citrobacter sp. JGM124]MBS0847382.1 protein tyrosine phosphatase [Citrobacter sp. JGM124]
MAKLMFQSVLVVCTGNICRSPVGERLLRQLLPNMTVDSAGTYGLTDEPADDTAAEIALRHGLSLDGHKARKLTSTIARHYDLILVMEPSHIEEVTKIAPEVRGKVMLYGQWLGKKEVPDPYRKSHDAHEHVYDLLDKASQEWARRLS